MKILVVYYSMYGHVLQLARAVEQGAKAVAGVDVILRRVAEFDDVIQKTAENEYVVKVREQQADIPVCTLDDLREADGVIFGSPTRYGNMTAQMKQLIDSTATLWLKGEMEGKPAGVFTSTASTHGGQETTLLTMMVPLIHLGMVIVGVPYSTDGMLHTEARGGTPYGATTIAGPRGELQPTKEDLAIASALGTRVATIAKKLSCREENVMPEVSFARDIRPLFRDVDISHMEVHGVKLDDYTFMSDPDNANKVLEALSPHEGDPPSMPPRGPYWTADQLALFAQWQNEGYQP